MCNITKKISKHQAIGYKVVIYKNGRFYSPHTGMEYKVGKIKQLNKARKNKLFPSDITDVDCRGHEPRMVGLTGIIMSMRKAMNLVNEFQFVSFMENNESTKNLPRLVVVQMKLKDIRYQASFCKAVTLLGSEITEITMLKEYRIPRVSIKGLLKYIK